MSQFHFEPLSDLGDFYVSECAWSFWRNDKSKSCCMILSNKDHDVILMVYIKQGNSHLTLTFYCQTDNKCIKFKLKVYLGNFNLQIK